MSVSGGIGSLGQDVDVGAWTVSVEPTVTSADETEVPSVSEYANYVYDQIDQALEYEQEQRPLPPSPRPRWSMRVPVG